MEINVSDKYKVSSVFLGIIHDIFYQRLQMLWHRSSTRVPTLSPPPRPSPRPTVDWQAHLSQASTLRLSVNAVVTRPSRRPPIMRLSFVPLPPLPLPSTPETPRRTCGALSSLCRLLHHDQWEHESWETAGEELGSCRLGYTSFFFFHFILFLLFLHLEARRAQAKISGIIGLQRFHILSLSRRLLVKKADSVLSRATRLVTCMTRVKETPQNSIHTSAALA